MRVHIIMIFLISTIVLTGCANDTIENDNTLIGNQNENVVIDSDEIAELEVTEPNEISEFSLHVNDNYISLNDWDNEVNIIGILGTPLSEEIKVLGDGADTHTGSYLKTLLYDGLEIHLFSPKQNGDSFWVLSMKITSQKYSTAQNVIVGDSLQKLKESYTNIEIAKDGRTDPNNCAYVIANNEKHLLFEIEDGIIKEINIYYEIN